MTDPVGIDTRRFDAVIIGLDGVALDATAIRLVRELRHAGVSAGAFSLDLDRAAALRAAGLEELVRAVVPCSADDRHRGPGHPAAAALGKALDLLGAPPERTVVIDGTTAGLSAACDAGVGLVIGVDPARRPAGPPRGPADLVVADLGELVVRSGFAAMSQIPNALASYGQLTGIARFRSLLVCVNVDGILDASAPAGAADPTAELLSGRAVGGLRELARQCRLAILSSRDLDELLERIDVPGSWYAGSRGLEFMAPDGARHRSELAALPDPRIAAGAVELHDTATALAWLRAKIDEKQELLPIYIGDGLVDEPALDAVRLDGIGIAVRHDGDDDRGSAANFIVNGPAQLSELIRRGANWLSYEKTTSDRAWSLTYHDYDPHSEKLREALCTTGNGYFASRGAAPECPAGQVHYPGTYAAGLYNRLADDISGVRVENESLVNLPNWLALTFRIDGGEWFDIGAVTVLAYRQVLDLRHAVLTREVRFRDTAGRTVELMQRRFVAMHLRHVGALETTITAVDWSGRLEVCSTVMGGVRNSLVERYRELSSAHLEDFQVRELSEDAVLLSARTSQSRVQIAIAARTKLWRNNTETPAHYRYLAEPDTVGHRITVDAGRGDTVRVEKVVTLFTGRDVAISAAGIDAALWLGRLGRFGVLLRGHRTAWDQLWQRMSIEFDGHRDQLRVIRLHLLHLLQTVSMNSADLDAGTPARGLHGEAYRGLIFWDELFIFPVLNLRFPMITRALLQYRYRRLPEARQAATDAGYAGAMFPWQSGSSGREECQRMHLNPRSGRWNPDASALAHHIGLAVAYNVWQFYQVTADLAYLIDYGAEMMVEIARFWVSRTSYDEERDRYVIRGVIGPDEFHSGYPDSPHDGIDNNAYTNVLAVWVILRALETLELLPLPNRLDLMERLGVDRVELARWRAVSSRMFVPFHNGLISQFEGYQKLAELDWDAYRKRYGDIHRLDRILEAEGDDINRYRASKQADVLMLFYLLSSDELIDVLSHLGYRLEAEHIPRMVDYYIARTSHGSTLSAVVHSWVLARANRSRAMEFFNYVLSSDVTDIQGGTTSEGIHTAAMAGSIDLVQRCFTGLEFRRNRIVLSPHWPKELGSLGFPIHYRGLHLYLRVSGEGAEISVEPRDAPPVDIEYRGQVRQLTPGGTTRFRWRCTGDGGQRPGSAVAGAAASYRPAR